MARLPNNPIELFASRLCVQMSEAHLIEKREIERHQALLAHSIQLALNEPPLMFDAKSYDYGAAIRMGINDFCKRSDVAIQTGRVNALLITDEGEESYIDQLVRLLASGASISYSKHVTEFGSGLVKALAKAIEALAEENDLHLPDGAQYYEFCIAVKSHAQEIVSNKDNYISSSDMASALGEMVNEETIAFFLRTHPERFEDSADVRSFMDYEDNKAYFMGAYGTGMEDPINGLAEAAFGEHYDVDDTLSDPLRENMERKLLDALLQLIGAKYDEDAGRNSQAAQHMEQAQPIAQLIASELAIYDTDNRGVMTRSARNQLDDDLAMLSKQGELGRMIDDGVQREVWVSALKSAVMQAYRDYNNDSPTRYSRDSRDNRGFGLE